MIVNLILNGLFQKKIVSPPGGYRFFFKLTPPPEFPVKFTVTSLEFSVVFALTPLEIHIFFLNFGVPGIQTNFTLLPLPHGIFH